MKEYKTTWEYRLRKSEEAALRRSGRSIMVPKQPVMDRIAEIMKYIPLVELSRLAHVPLETMYNWRTHNGHRKVHRMYAERIMSFQLPADATTYQERLTGARRVYRGLACRGFNMQVICDMMGIQLSGFKNIVCEGPHTKRGISVPMYLELLRAAGKLETANPYDLLPSKSVNVTKGKAKGFGWVDIGAWDLDTVHRLDSKPDITGHCGRVAGCLIHLREGQPLCESCELVTHSKYNQVDPHALFEAVMKGDRTYLQVSKLLGVSKDLVSQYAQYLRPEERKTHGLSMVDKTAMTAYCDLCCENVKLYVSSHSKVVCSNGVKQYRAANAS